MQRIRQGGTRAVRLELETLESEVARSMLASIASFIGNRDQLVLASRTAPMTDIGDEGTFKVKVKGCRCNGSLDDVN